MITILCTLASCISDKSVDDPYNVRVDFRLSGKFYSIMMNESGRSYAIKGLGSYYEDSLKIAQSDTSEIFKLDSAAQFFINLDKIKKDPVIGSNYMGAPRVEIYYDRSKIYDSYRWDEDFWDLFRPIMHQIPKGFNPFNPDDRPFE